MSVGRNKASNIKIDEIEIKKVTEGKCLNTAFDKFNRIETEIKKKQ